MVVICEFCGFSSLLEPTTMPLDCTMGTVSRYSTATTGRSNFHTVVCQSVCRSPLYLRPRYRARHRLRCITGTETVSLPSHATVRLEKYYNEQLSKSGGVAILPGLSFGMHSTRGEVIAKQTASLMYSQFIIKFMPQFSAPLIHCPRKVANKTRC